MVNCSQCMLALKMTKTNTEAKNHAESKHPLVTFAVCFPGQFDPTVVVAAPQPSVTPVSVAPVKKAVPKADDLSFLDAALTTGKKGKK